MGTTVPTDITPGHLREFNGRLCSLLMPALPERLKETLMGDLAAKSDTDKEASTVATSDEIWHQVSPRGSLELNGLRAFARNPGVTTGELGKKRFREWNNAQKRADINGIPALSCHGTCRCPDQDSQGDRSQHRSLQAQCRSCEMQARRGIQIRGLLMSTNEWLRKIQW